MLKLAIALVVLGLIAAGLMALERLNGPFPGLWRPEQALLPVEISRC